MLEAYYKLLSEKVPLECKCAVCFCLFSPFFFFAETNTLCYIKVMLTNGYKDGHKTLLENSLLLLGSLEMLFIFKSSLLVVRISQGMVIC